MKVLVTGVAGFIGMHVAKRLLDRGDQVVGVDNLNPYYDPLLKKRRLKQLESYKEFSFFKGDIADAAFVSKIFFDLKPHKVINLAAQAGVRYSLENPSAYVQSNLVGFANILEGCRNTCVKHLVYASSSSVYGANTKVPFSVEDSVDRPVSLYAATKKSNELMAHSYSHLFNLPTTGLRYFTVYGPWGRPDMAPWLFTSAILEGRTINVFNHGKMLRDFTYIDDIVDGTVGVLDRIPEEGLEGVQGSAPYSIYNVGNNSPVPLSDFISCIESAVGIVAKKKYLPMQDGDVPNTYADINALKLAIGFVPRTNLVEGIGSWVEWYKANIAS
ncbi:NAD-dependent epimerase [Metapseudomonas otitidis]